MEAENEPVPSNTPVEFVVQSASGRAIFVVVSKV
jgi:hypothetical protein